MKYNVSLYYIIFFVLTCVRGLKCHQIIHLNRQNFFVNLWGWLPYFIYIEAIQCLLNFIEQEVFILGTFNYYASFFRLFSFKENISLPYCLAVSRQFHGFFNVSCYDHVLFLSELWSLLREKLLQSNRNGPTFFDIFMIILIDPDSIESPWFLYILNPHWLVFYDYLSFHSFWFHNLEKLISYDKI